jgi:hypothetical protein
VARLSRAWRWGRGGGVQVPQFGAGACHEASRKVVVGKQAARQAGRRRQAGSRQAGRQAGAATGSQHHSTCRLRPPPLLQLPRLPPSTPQAATLHAVTQGTYGQPRVGIILGADWRGGDKPRGARERVHALRNTLPTGLPPFVEAVWCAGTEQGPTRAAQGTLRGSVATRRSTPPPRLLHAGTTPTQALPSPTPTQALPSPTPTQALHTPSCAATTAPAAAAAWPPAPPGPAPRPGTCS